MLKQGIEPRTSGTTVWCVTSSTTERINCFKVMGLNINKNKGLHLLTISALSTLKKSFYKEHQNVSMITKYNLFTVNKWIFKTPKSVLYRKSLDF